jgi:FKBP-type peptidyl-prolyl cis-trans isomerase SlyD
MIINGQCVASFHYTLKNDDGDTLDSSEGQEPLSYLNGAGNIVPGLEKELEGKSVGDKFAVSVKPEDGYGNHEDGLIQEMPSSMFSGVESVDMGMEFHAQTEHGKQVVTVTKVEDDTITVDGNHPLAGQTLNFTIEVSEVRKASPEELDHGHVHGPGGHHH